MSAAAVAPTSFAPVQTTFSAQGNMSAPVDGLVRPAQSSSQAASQGVALQGAPQTFSAPISTMAQPATIHSTPSYVSTTPQQLPLSQPAVMPYRVPSNAQVAMTPAAPMTVTSSPAGIATGPRQASTQYPTSVPHYQTMSPPMTTGMMHPSSLQTIPATSYPTTTFSQHGTTFMPQGPPLTTATTGSLTGAEYAIQSAINQGRVYAPAGSVFVPGALAARSGMTTPYDASVVPTFETPLVFQSAVQQIRSRGGSVSEHRESKVVKVLKGQKKSACC